MLPGCRVHPVSKIYLSTNNRALFLVSHWHPGMLQILVSVNLVLTAVNFGLQQLNVVQVCSLREQFQLSPEIVFQLLNEIAKWWRIKNDLRKDFTFQIDVIHLEEKKSDFCCMGKGRITCLVCSFFSDKYTLSFPTTKAFSLIFYFCFIIKYIYYYI